jgi:hypothetical protein
MSGWILLLLAVAVYFLPWIVTAVRKTKRRAGIVLINLFLGWTLLGWLGALIWAMYDSQGEE